MSRKRKRLFLHVGPQRFRLRRPSERWCSGKALVEHAPQRVAVGATVHFLAPDLLRRQVVERADQALAVGGHPAQLLGDAEVGQVGVPLLVQENVCRLHVAVNQTAPMGGVEGVRDLREDPHRTLGRELPVAVEQRPQVAPLDVPHRQVELSLPLARLVDRDHARVIERRGEPRLLEKTGSEMLVLRELGRDQLQRDRPLQRQIPRAVHDAHPAASHQRLHSIPGKRGARADRQDHQVAPVRDQLKRVRASAGARPPGRGPLRTRTVGAGGASAISSRTCPSPS